MNGVGKVGLVGIAIVFMGALSFGVTQSHAVDEPVSLEALLALGVPLDDSVVDAFEALVEEEAALARTVADPSSTALQRVAAERAVRRAVETVEVARVTAEHALTEKVLALLEAWDARDAAREDLAILEARWEATVARFEAGAVTALDVTDAENAVAAAARTLANREEAAARAERDVTSSVGQRVTQVARVELDDLPDVPARENVTAEALAVSQRVRTAVDAVAAAEEALAALRHALSARVDVEDAEATLEAAKRNVVRVEDSVTMRVRNAYETLIAAERTLASREEALRVSLERMEGQRSRFDAGTISALALRESEASHVDARIQRDAALHDVWIAHAALRVAMVE